MWGWGGDKTEVVNGFECKVYSATGVEVLTKTRVEHLNAEDKKTAQSEFFYCIFVSLFNLLINNLYNLYN